MPINIFATKSITGNPFDGVDNATISIFGRMSADDIVFSIDAPSDFSSRGSLKVFNVSAENQLLKLLKKLFFLIKIKPEIIWGIANNWELLFLIFKPKKSKYVINLHTVLLKDENYWRVKTPWFFRKFLFGRADKIICASEFIASSARKYFPKKDIVPILNGVDIDFFNPKKCDTEYLYRKFNIDTKKPLVVCVGILHPRKRPDFFIDLAKKCHIANFVLVGKKIDSYNFLSGTKNLNNFCWVETMSRDDIAILFASSYVFVFPGLNEPSAAVIGEALASGLPIIVSNSGGNREFVKNGENGYLISFNGTEEDVFLQCINTYLNDENLRNNMSKNARLTAENNLAFDRVANLYKNQILEKII